MDVNRFLKPKNLLDLIPKGGAFIRPSFFWAGAKPRIPQEKSYLHPPRS